MIRNLGRSLLVSVTSFLSLAAHAIGQNVYIDQLQNAWQDWSWGGNRNFANTSPVHTLYKSISFTATSAWGALNFHHVPIDSSSYSGIRLWINGGAGGQKLQAAGLLDGVVQDKRVTIGPLPANTWQKVVIPLADIGVAGKLNFDGFWLQDITGTAAPTWYLDDVVLVEPSTQPTVHVTVDAAAAIRKVDFRQFGVNTAVWDASFANASTASLLAKAGTKIMRFPGGSLSDTYRWATGKSDGNDWAWATNFDTFATTAKQIGSQAYITVNYGSGTPEEAAAWVQYSNVTQGYGFRYWEIGNENYGSWENDLNSRPHDPVTYATRAKLYIQQMKAVDPTIKIGVVVEPGEDSYANYGDESVQNLRTGATHSGWTPVMLSTLKTLGVRPDFVIYHRYEQGPGNEWDGYLLNAARGWADAAQNLRQMLKDYLGSTVGSKVELACTENNSVYTNPGKQTTSIIDGLYYADSVAQLMKTEFRSLVWWDLRNGQETGNNNASYLRGWRQYGDYGIMSANSEPYPTYYALKLMKYFARGGDTVIGASSDFSPLSAYAVKRANGSLTILLINKMDLPLDTVFTINGQTVGASGKRYTYGLSTDRWMHDIGQTTLPTGQTFTAQFSAFSMTVISLPPP